MKTSIRKMSKTLLIIFSKFTDIPFQNFFLSISSRWKPTHLTSVFSVRTSIFIASWYYANSLCRCPYGCWRMLERLISTHPPFSLSQRQLLPRGARGRIQTHDLRIMSRLLYHYATACGFGQFEREKRLLKTT
jgi:hypothetical protein